MLNASTYVCELCAIISAVKKWRTNLLGRKFTIYTDQRSLRELMTQVIQTPEQQFYLAKLLGYSYDIIYKPGAQNRVVDALSRVHEQQPQFLAITVPHWDFLQQLQASLAQDDQLQQLIGKVHQNPAQYSDYNIVNGLLFFSNKLFIPEDSPFKKVLLEEFHSSQ